MIAYDDRLFLFGGSGAYIPSAKMKASFNDLWCFNTNSEIWSQMYTEGDTPKKRMSHVASRLGCIMMIHGGFSSVGKVILDDFNLYDIELNRWL